MPAVQGSQAKLGMSDSGAADEAFEFLNENIMLNDTHHESDGIVGSRDYPSERVRQNISAPGGNISMQPNAAELALLTPRILGGATAVADTLPSFNVVIDRIMKVFTYAGCLVNRAVFRASQGGPLSVELAILGVSETIGNAGTFPSLTIDTATGPFMMHDLSITVGGVTYKFFDIEISVDNMLEVRHLNSLTPTSITPRSRLTTVSLTSPYGDASALYTSNLPGAAVAATFTNGSNSAAFSLPAVAIPRTTPNVSGKTEIRLPLRGVARKSGSTPSLSITIT